LVDEQHAIGTWHVLTDRSFGDSRGVVGSHSRMESKVRES